MIIRFYNYIYYRIYHTLYQLELKQNEFLKFKASTHPDTNRLNHFCAFYVASIISINLFSVLFLFYLIFKSTLPTYYYLSKKTLLIFLFIINFFFYMLYSDTKLFIRLQKSYKREKYKKIKGWGVFIYICFSIILIIYLSTNYN